jgi:SAM-dependent methyltransferase
MPEELFWQQPVTATAERMVLELSGIDRCPKASAFRVLDFGCGYGRYMEMFGRWIPQSSVFGVDTDPQRVIEAKRKGLNSLRTGPQSGCLPFKDKSFALVFSSNVVEHIPRALYLAYLEEIHRVLEPQGRFVVSTPNYPFKRVYDLFKALKTEHTSYYLFDDPTHVNRLSLHQLERDLRDVFSEVHLKADHVFLQNRIPLLRHPNVQRRLRVLGDKAIGYCVK